MVTVAARAQVSRLKNVVGSYENLRDDCKESSKVREEEYHLQYLGFIMILKVAIGRGIGEWEGK